MLGKTTRSRLAGRHRPGSGEVMLGEGGQLMEVYSDGSMAPCQYVTIGEDGDLQAVAPLNNPPGIAGHRAASLRQVGQVVRGRSGQLYESVHGRMRPLGGELVAGDDGSLYELSGLAYPVGQKFIKDPVHEGKVVKPPGAKTQTPETRVKKASNVPKPKKKTVKVTKAKKTKLGGYGDDLEGGMYFDDELDGADYEDYEDYADYEDYEDYDNEQLEFDDTEFVDEDELSEEEMEALQHESEYRSDELEGALNADELEGFVQLPFVQEPGEKPATGAIRPTDAPKGMKGTIFESYF